MAFEMRTQKTKESALLMATNNSMSKTYSDSATLMEAMWKDFLQKNNISRTTFYEKEGVHPSGFETDYPLNKANVLQQLQKQTVGLSVIVSNGGFMDDLKQYLIAKLLWNTRADVKAIRADFLKGFYGKAAEPVDQYLNLLHDKVRKDNIHGFIFNSPQATAGLNCRT